MHYEICRTKVLLSAAASDDGIKIRVFDDGVIPESDGDSDVTESGSGVGLWIANRIAMAHRNGELRGYAKHSVTEELGSCFELFVR